MSTLPSNERLLELVGELDHYAETEGYERGYPGGLYSGQRQRARAELEAGIRALTSHETPEGRTAAKYSCSNNHEPVFYSADRCPVCVVLTGLAAVHEAEHRSLKAGEQ